MIITTAIKIPKTIALYGDSYITRRQDNCYEDLHVPCHVYWFGKGGLRSDFINRKGLFDVDSKSKFQDLKELKPDAVFVNVGGNDLSTTSTPKQIFEQIVSLTVELQQAGVKDIYMAEILTRGDFSRCPDPKMDKTCFDRQRKKINSLLKGEFKANFVRFTDISYPDDYLQDLVHLGTTSSVTRNTGMKKFESRIRQIICRLKN